VCPIIAFSIIATAVEGLSRDKCCSRRRPAKCMCCR